MRYRHHTPRYPVAPRCIQSLGKHWGWRPNAPRRQSAAWCALGSSCALTPCGLHREPVSHRCVTQGSDALQVRQSVAHFYPTAYHGPVGVMGVWWIASRPRDTTMPSFPEGETTAVALCVLTVLVTFTRCLGLVFCRRLVRRKQSRNEAFGV